MPITVLFKHGSAGMIVVHSTQNAVFAKHPKEILHYENLYGIILVNLLYHGKRRMVTPKVTATILFVLHGARY